jgi:hypothetical protein
LGCGFWDGGGGGAAVPAGIQVAGAILLTVIQRNLVWVLRFLRVELGEAAKLVDRTADGLGRHARSRRIRLEGSRGRCGGIIGRVVSLVAVEVSTRRRIARE